MTAGETDSHATTRRGNQGETYDDRCNDDGAQICGSW
jgi:hypothetical protein